MAGRPHDAAAVVARRDRYFVSMAALMIVLNFAGFAPSYFLKSLFDSPPLPLRLHVHGAVFGGWFLLFFVQTSLVGVRRVDLHRRVGIAGVVLACAMIVSGLDVLYARALAYHVFGGDLAVTAGVVWANLGLLTLFTVFVTGALAQRARPEAHKRLMLLACISMIGQSTGRLGRYEALAFSDAIFVNEGLYGLGGLVLLLASLFVYDVRVRGRPHPATVWGAPTLFLTLLLMGFLAPNTAFGQSLILMIG